MGGGDRACYLKMAVSRRRFGWEPRAGHVRERNFEAAEVECEAADSLIRAAPICVSIPRYHLDPYYIIGMRILFRYANVIVMRFLKGFHIKKK